MAALNFRLRLRRQSRKTFSTVPESRRLSAKIAAKPAGIWESESVVASSSLDISIEFTQEDSSASSGPCIADHREEFGMADSIMG